MKKCALIFGALLLFVPVFSMAQTIMVDDQFGGLGDWEPASGEWTTLGGFLFQNDETDALARIDFPFDHQGEFQIEFKVRYRSGGFGSMEDLQNQRFHGGFGIHVGVDEAALGEVAWGNGESYLLWLNLDTRPATQANYPQHFGFRGQVYESTANYAMDLTDMNVDIMAALASVGINMSVNDLNAFINQNVPMRIRVNTRTGRILVNDPTSPTTWFYLDVDPAVLRAGNYLSLRTNGLGLRFDDFRIVRR